MGIGREKQNDSYYSKFENRETENIFIAPIHIAFHRDKGLIGDEYNIFQFPDANDTKVYRVNNHHPTFLGEKHTCYITMLLI